MLSYVVNKSFILGEITQWLLLLLEFEFKVVHNLRNEHVVTNFLLRTDGEKGALEDQERDFVIEIYTIPRKWNGPI
jgi:hypothetical protein